MFFTVSGPKMALTDGFDKKAQAKLRKKLKLAQCRMKKCARMDEKSPRVGSTLESLLRENGIYEDAKNCAIKSVLACKLAQIMEAQNLSKARMAERMETSRSQLDRLLDPENDSVTLRTLMRAASAVGMRLEIDLR